MEDKEFGIINGKSFWQAWKEAPWLRWHHQKLTNVKKSREQFVAMKWHFRFGRWEKVGRLPVYKGNLGKVLDFFQRDICWKEKFDTPRLEYNPMVSITLFWTWTFLFWYGFTPEQHRQGYYEDGYWEQYLWTTYWSDGNIDKARENWPWKDRDGNSTWDDRYLKTK